MLKIVRCGKCDVLFKQTKINQKYCVKCKKTMPTYIKNATMWKTCPVCEEQFATTYKRQIFCSLKCKNIRYSIKQEKEPRRCKYRKCNKMFNTTNSNKDYCCSAHYYAEKLAREHEARGAK